MLVAYRLNFPKKDLRSTGGLNNRKYRKYNRKKYSKKRDLINRTAWRIEYKSKQVRCKVCIKYTYINQWNIICAKCSKIKFEWFRIRYFKIEEIQWFLAMRSVKATSMMSFYLRITNDKSLPAKYISWYLLKQSSESRNITFIAKNICFYVIMFFFETSVDIFANLDYFNFVTLFNQNIFLLLTFPSTKY